MKNFFLVGVIVILLTMAAESQETSRPNAGSAEPCTQNPSRVRVSRPVAEKLLVRKVAPEYPSEALKQRIEGDVVLRVVIDKLGIVREATYVAGNSLLKEAAIEAMKKYRFQAYMLNGEPVEMETQLNIPFRLAQPDLRQ